tara:strand:- start:270 stop:794 length:525 start_codon:yes stop_codon:yes gene_type:complete
MIKKDRGRPKQYPVILDRGTPEQQLKRITLVNGGNPNMSTNPIDIMYERNMINEEHHKAAMNFLSINRKIFGRAYPESNTGKLLTPISGRSLQRSVSKKDKETWDLYKDINLYLQETISISQLVAIRNIIIFEEYPSYLLHNEMLHKDNSHKKMVKSALDVLVKFFNTKRKKRK